MLIDSRQLLRCQYVVFGSVKNGLPFFKQDHILYFRNNLFNMMSYDDYGGAPGSNIADQLQAGFPGNEVQGGRWLIQHQQIRRGDQRAGNKYASGFAG